MFKIAITSNPTKHVQAVGQLPPKRGCGVQPQPPPTGTDRCPCCKRGLDECLDESTFESTPLGLVAHCPRDPQLRTQ